MNSKREQEEARGPKIVTISLSRLENINRQNFEKMFCKPILHRAIRNQLELLEMSFKDENPDTEFMLNYPTDQLSDNFEVLKLQREYLYQTFHDVPLRELMASYAARKEFSAVNCKSKPDKKL